MSQSSNNIKHTNLAPILVLSEKGAPGNVQLAKPTDVLIFENRQAGENSLFDRKGLVLKIKKDSTTKRNARDKRKTITNKKNVVNLRNQSSPAASANGETRRDANNDEYQDIADNDNVASGAGDGTGEIRIDANNDEHQDIAGNDNVATGAGDGNGGNGERPFRERFARVFFGNCRVVLDFVNGHKLTLGSVAAAVIVVSGATFLVWKLRRMPKLGIGNGASATEKQNDTKIENGKEQNGEKGIPALLPADPKPDTTKVVTDKKKDSDVEQEDLLRQMLERVRREKEEVAEKEAKLVEREKIVDSKVAKTEEVLEELTLRIKVLEQQEKNQTKSVESLTNGKTMVEKKEAEDKNQTKSVESLTNGKTMVEKKEAEDKNKSADSAKTSSEKKSPACRFKDALGRCAKR
jgi:hypothetical protein